MRALKIIRTNIKTISLSKLEPGQLFSFPRNQEGDNVYMKTCQYLFENRDVYSQTYLIGCVSLGDGKIHRYSPNKEVTVLTGTLQVTTI